MFESALIDRLKTDSIITDTLSTYEGDTAMFNISAPEGVADPFIVIRIDKLGGSDPVIERFNIYIDYYDYGQSRSKANQIAERIEFVLDRSELQSDRYDTIRIFRLSGDFIQEDDIRSIHYNYQFTARAGRKKWMQETLS